MARAVKTWSRSGHTHLSKLQRTWALFWRHYLRAIWKYKGKDDSRGRWTVLGGLVLRTNDVNVEG